MGFGYIEGVTHDYQLHGTTTLFAALNVLVGGVVVDDEMDVELSRHIGLDVARKKARNSW
jgi:hypothetical protein